MASAPIVQPSSRAPSRNLDVLRAFAVATVFFGHLYQSFIAHGSPFVGHVARFGVLAFFVHTSFVLMQSLERLSRDGGRTALRFYVRRLFRIYPLAVAAVLVTWFWSIPPMPWNTAGAVSRGTLVANLLLVQNLAGRPSILSPLWSLPYEVQMYVLLPACFWFVSAKRLSALWLVVAAATIFLLPVEFIRDLVHYAPCFLAGVWAYQKSRTLKTAVLPAWVWPLFITATCAAYASLTTAVRVSVPELYQLLPLVALDWCCSLAIALAIPRVGEIGRGLGARVANEIAKYSYGIYLSHIPVMWLTGTVMSREPFLMRVSVFAGLAVLLPVIAYHALESPFIELGRRLSEPTPRHVSHQATSA